MPCPELLELGQSSGWHADINLLLHIIDTPTSEEVRAHSAGPVELAVLERSPLLVLTARYGRSFLFEMPWAWTELDDEPPAWVHDDSDGHLLFKSVLVDLRTGIVASLRSATADRRFSRRLCEAARKAGREGPISVERCRQLALQHQQRYSDSRQVVERAQFRGRLGE